MKNQDSMRFENKRGRIAMVKKDSDNRKKEREVAFFIEAAKALGWYRREIGIKQEILGSKVALSGSAISKYLIDPKMEKNFSNEEDLKRNSKLILTLEYALEISEAMGTKLCDILCLYEKHKKETANCTKLNESGFLNMLNFNTENLITDVDDSKYKPWFGDFFCYFSSTSSSEINKSKRENRKGLMTEEQELFDITPSGDHLFCGKMSISKAEDNYCQVSLRFMSDKCNHNIKHYQGTLILSRQYSAGFISLYGQENGECSYIIVESPDSRKLKCRMAMVLTLSSIDGHRRACAEKMLITKKRILEGSKAYQALKVLLPMNDSAIRITDVEYEKFLEELSASDNQELRQFADRYPELSDIVKTNSTIEKYESITIPESTINNWKKLSSESRTQLRMLMRKHSFVNWYYKANNKKAEEIYYIISEDYANEEEDDMNEMI